MSSKNIFFHRRGIFLLVATFSLAAVQPGFAAEEAPAPSVTVMLIKRLTERGAITKEDSAELMLLAEADAADARAQIAMTQAALAQAAAAQARLKAVTAILAARQSSGTSTAAVSPAPGAVAPVAADPMPEETEPVVTPPPRPRVAEVAPHRKAPAAPAPTPVATPAEETAESEPEAPKAVMQAAAAPAAATPDDVVRVTYVPEVVKAQLREEVKQDVMEQAREENWASPRAFPDWVSRFRLFGDIRIRYEAIRFPDGNDNTGAFPNFNAINTGAPFDVTGAVFSPQLDVDQNRNRARLRARLGSEMDLGQNFSAGLRLATGESNSPVSENQSFGAVSAGQGGNFSKYAIWLDRAFLKYELGGLPDKDFTFSLGRFDNPFMSTSMIWADDIGFDGFVAQGRFPLGEDVTPFYSAGAFPVFNTDLNFASNQPAKFKSNDKWLYGTQVGVTWELAKDVSLKVGAAYYLFKNIEGKLSTPFTPLNATDSGDTDSSRPAFAQKGNTYMALRDIIPSSLNGNGTTNQFQYFGLATPFTVMAFDSRLDFNKFEPFQISLVAEYARNQALDSSAIAAKAVNNLGPVATGETIAPYLGSGTAWLAGIVVGDAGLKERWDWNVNFGYRKVGSDALVDGFVDSDFGGGGTNVKGFTFGGNLALSSSVRLGLRWMSASEVVGPALKSDIIQMDLTGKF